MKMESKSEIHTKLAAFFAKRIVEIEAKLMALEATVGHLHKLHPTDFAEIFLGHLAEQKGIAQKLFQAQLDEDPELAWFVPEVSELLH